MDIALPVFLLLFLTFCSGYFSASETALFSLSATKIKAFQSNRDPRKRLIAHLVLQPRDLLVTVFMLNTLVNILLQNTASHIFGSSASWLLKVGVPLLLMLLFGEIIPKYIGLQNNVSLAHAFAPVINFLQNLLKPIRRLIIDVTSPISRIMFFFLKKEKSISKEELKHVLKTSQEHGVLNPDEAELVWGYFTLQESKAKELMRPREDILFYDVDESLTKLTHLFVDKKCSRIPVCKGSFDNIIGIINVKQFLQHRSLQTSEELIPLLQKPYYVPEATPARTLLRRLKEQHEEIALVVDEYGSISGLIAYEDLVEAVVGEISDQRDEQSLYTRAGKDEIIASGRLELSEVNEIFNSNLESENNMLTIGGWLIEQLGDIPKGGTKFEKNNLLFQVLAADPQRIRRLYIRKIHHKNSKK